MGSVGEIGGFARDLESKLRNLPASWNELEAPSKDRKLRVIVPQESGNGAGKIAEAKQEFPVRFIRMDETSMHTF